MAHDRANGLLVMPVNNIASEVRLIPRGDLDEQRSGGRLASDFELHLQRGTPYALVRRLLLGPKTLLPCTPPPWGTLAAVRTATGEIAWQVPLGKFPGTESAPDAAKWGSIALGGPIVTAGGLVFTAGTLEAAIYAFDVQTGRQLWTGQLPTSARSTPMTYRGPDGRQYIVIAAGGHGVQIGPPLGDYLVAFALPDITSQKK
jgi:quinoprotein glucose dehydrogenase